MTRAPERILVLADDLTGALEIGAKFAAEGIPASVHTKPGPIAAGPETPVVVFDTETRHRTAEDAERELLRFLPSWSPRLIFKKTDSTLRGNIGAELDALSNFYGGAPITYAPAYPALGRIVKKGVLYVDGVPVAETEFGRDRLNAVRTSLVRELLGAGVDCTVVDGEHDHHVRAAAVQILLRAHPRIAAGPAALAEALAREIDLPRVEPSPLPRIATCLVLNGSLHPRACEQMHYVEAPGWTVVKRGPSTATEAVEVAKENAAALRDRLRAERPDAVFVTGGDTAFAVVEELGMEALMPLREIVPGVPVSVTDSGLVLITKAGGFGPADLFPRVRAALQS